MEQSTKKTINIYAVKSSFKMHGKKNDRAEWKKKLEKSTSIIREANRALSIIDKNPTEKICKYIK